MEKVVKMVNEKNLLHNLEMSKEWEVFQKRQQDKMRLLVRMKVV